ncbi:MAG TPA: sugar phosphate nucleotidyltransferase [Xanthomonadales bacterium]|nr:sugar phosphate nucleotidyltransferase [Xanthomonadales bacterium]
MINNRKLGAIILAAGRGKRMQSKKANKVTLHLANKPLILHSIHLLEKMKFEEIVVLVGYAKDSVKNVLKESNVVFAEQKKRLGTGHAVKVAFKSLDLKITDVLIIYGDDSHFYNEKIISSLIKEHYLKKASITFLTITVANPFGLGRIVRDKSGEVMAITEEKDATEKIRKIKEVNPACYIFDVEFLKKYLPKIPKSKVTGEYYLTSLIDIAIKNAEKIATFKVKNMPWRGVNTREELLEAEKIYMKLVD